MMNIYTARFLTSGPSPPTIPPANSLRAEEEEPWPAGTKALALARREAKRSFIMVTVFCRKMGAKEAARLRHCSRRCFSRDLSASTAGPVDMY